MGILGAMILRFLFIDPITLLGLAHTAASACTTQNTDGDTQSIRNTDTSTLEKYVK